MIDEAAVIDRLLQLGRSSDAAEDHRRHREAEGRRQGFN